MNAHSVMRWFGDDLSRLSPALVEADEGAAGLAVGAALGLAPRLLIAEPGREDIAAYRARGGYAAGAKAGDLIQQVMDAGLLGRGGAAFPTGVKLQTLADQPGPKYLVANGDEGEPASVKDRWLMRRRPHLLIDGLLRAAEAITADRCYIYISDDAAAASVHAAFDELGETPRPVEIVRVERRYVAGEETSVVRFINGGPAKPTDKPPRPFQSGIGERPTLVSNVETFCNLPFIAVHGAEVYRAVGGEGDCGGTVLLTVTGAVERPGLYEVPLGTTLDEVMRDMSGLLPGARALLMGGFFAGLLPPDSLDLELSYGKLKEEGSGLGCGAIVAIGEDDCPVAAAGDVMAYFARENAGQCGACFRGTPAMSEAIRAIGLGEAEPATIERLKGWSVSLRGRGACATLDGAAQLAASLFHGFGEEIDRHLSGKCPRCARLLPAAATTRFAVEEVRPAAAKE